MIYQLPPYVSGRLFLFLITMNDFCKIIQLNSYNMVTVVAYIFLSKILIVIFCENK